MQKKPCLSNITTYLILACKTKWLIAFYIHTLGIEDIGNSRGGVMNNVAWKFQGGVVLCHISRVQCKR
jgi:hypothetical protein